jgi:energy-coupling factor transport system substrate-specific component
MREVFTMWRDTRMILLVAVVAAVYAAILSTSQSIPSDITVI